MKKNRKIILASLMLFVLFFSLLYVRKSIVGTPFSTAGEYCDVSQMNDVGGSHIYGYAGYNIWVKGYEEHCSDGGVDDPQVYQGIYLVETYCWNYALQVDLVRCSYYGNYVCRDGECVPSDITTTTVTTTLTTTTSPTCSDTDGGDDKFNQGTVTATVGSSGTDYCFTWSGKVYLREFYCSDGVGDYDDYICNCADGACVPETTTTVTTTTITTTTTIPEPTQPIDIFFGWIDIIIDIFNSIIGFFW